MPTSELPDSMAVGDFNDDGHLDLGMVGSYYGVTGNAPMSCWATAPGGLSAIFHVARR